MRIRLLIFYLPFFIAAGCSASVPDSSSIVGLQEKGKSAASDFYSNSIESRLSFFYHSGFVNDKYRQELKQSALAASDSLSEILIRQREFKSIIENYPGDDWQKRFGRTGLWQKIKSDIANTVLLKGGIDYYLGLTETDKNKEYLAAGIIESVHSEPLLAKAPLAKLITAQAYWLEGDSGRAVKLLDSVKGFEAAVFRLEITDANIAKIEKVYEELKKSGSSKNFELNARLAFLQLRAGSDNILRKVSAGFPSARQFLGRCALEKMAVSPQSMQPGEISLAVETAAVEPTGQYNNIILKAVNSVRSAEVFNLAGRIVSKTAPSEAIAYFLSASDSGSKTAAASAASLAWKSYKTGKISSQKALPVFENYIEKTLRPDDAIYYAYTVILRNCGQSRKSIELLKKIAADSNSRFSCQAGFEVVAADISQTNDSDGAVGKILSLVHRCPGQIPAAAVPAKKVLFALLNRLDEKSSNQDLIKNCAALAGKISAVCGDKMKLAAIEFASVIRDVNSAELAELHVRLRDIEKSLAADNPDLLRCRARLLTAAGNFDQAYPAWTKILNLNNASGSPLWWQAKYYQLLSLSKSSLPGSSKAGHAADVLINSFTDIPPFWLKKLRLLTSETH